MRLYLGCLHVRQFVVGTAEHAANERVEHLDDRVGHLLGPDAEEGEHERLALGRRVAAEVAGAQSPDHTSPLPPPARGDQPPADPNDQSFTD